ncbi:MAG: LL-diaminopimelate aminotransferase [Chloroflexi bacterium]|nr:LL-diaminopimelate aminotransferase [Chloroflexota bacterium]
MRAAQRIANLPPYLFAEVDRRIAAKRAAGYDVISLGIGDPDLPTPRYILDALVEAAGVPANHRYPDYYGLAELRRAIARWYEGRFGVVLHPDTEVLPLIGSKEGIAHVALALVDPGDVALVPSPAYPVYEIGTMLAGGEVYHLPLRPGHQFLPDLDAIPQGVLDRARVLWVNYPNNPTSAVAGPEFFERVVAFARRHDVIVLHDNAYSEVYYDGYRPGSFLQTAGARDVGVEFHSLSKSYNMTGWRIGMVVGHAAVIEALGRVKTNVDSGIFQAVQYAGIVALTGDQSWIPARNAVYEKRRDLLIDVLQGLGIKVGRPRASLYLWGPVPEGYGSLDFSVKLLDEIAVWVTPGVGFGPHGEGFFRISLTTPDDRVRQAAERLRQLRL